jgi:prepilin-type N-terminal cleavage/methylation domain-containing protein
VRTQVRSFQGRVRRARPRVRRGRARARGGFTLVEIMAVVALISITAALSTPSFLGMLENRRVQKDALALLATLQDARTRAVGRGGAVRVGLDVDATTGGDLVRVTEVYDDLNSDTKIDVPSYWCGGTTAPRLVSMAPIGDFSRRTAFQMDVGGDRVSQLSLCFTPRGSAFVLDTTSTPARWRALSAAIHIAVLPLDPQGAIVEERRSRRILISPTGDARMLL